MVNIENYKKLIKEIYNEIKHLSGIGKVANYIPALAQVNPNKFAVAISTVNGENYLFGDVEEKFSIQSISKVFTLAIAFGNLGERIWKRVGKEPSGNPFNSLVQLEYENGIPRNPFINAGALVLTDSIYSITTEPNKEILNFVKKISNSDNVNFDYEVAKSEKENGYRNFALANFMKSFGNIENNVEEVLETYFLQCSLSMSAQELADSFLFLANHGVIPATGEKILSVSQTKRMNALMLTCGLYDESGDFAFRVGLPAKSGVGGGIVAIIPGELSICIWSPELNKFGNSLMGIKFLELFTTKTGKSIF